MEDRVPGYVLFHLDGDRSWRERDTAENTAKLAAFLHSLRPLIEKNLRDRGLLSEENDTAAIVTERLRRICPVTPYYSIEAWLYQNTARARELCQQGCGKHLELIDEWERDRALLDEVIKPKEQVCFKGRNNAELAETFDNALADALYELGKSFHHVVERLQSCPGLAEALRATWEPATASPA